MKKRILASILAVLMVVLLVPAVLISSIFAIPASALPNITIGDTKEIVVSEDFESTPIDPFFNLTGFAQAVDGTKGVYKGTSGAPIFFDQQQFGDGVLQFDVKMENISTIYRTLSMWFGCSAATSYPDGYQLYIGGNNQGWTPGNNVAVPALVFYKRQAGQNKIIKYIANADTVAHPAALDTALSAGGISIEVNPALPTFDPATYYNIKIVRDNGNIKVYINDIMFIDYTDSTPFGEGYIGLSKSNANNVYFDNFQFYNPLTLSAATFNLGSAFANRKVDLDSDEMTATANAQGQVTFSNIAAGTHQLKVYDAAGTNVAYTANLFLAQGTALEAGGNGVNMTSAGATITLQLVSGQLVITDAVSGYATSSSAASSTAASSAASSTAASSSVAASSTAASSATSSIGATGLANITMGKTQNSLLSENFDGNDVNAAFNDMIIAGCTTTGGKLSNAAVAKDQYGNKDRVYTTSATSFSDYIFEADVATNYGAAYRFSNFLFHTSTYTATSGKTEGNYYTLQIGRYADMPSRTNNLQVWVAKRAAGTNSFLLGTSSTDGVQLPDGTGITAAAINYHLKVIISGTSFKAYVGDVLIADVTLDGAYSSGGFGLSSTNSDIALDNINIYNPLTLSGATFDLGADYANRKVELYSTVKTGTTNAQGLVTFSNIEAGTHQLKVYNAAGTGVDYTVDLFLAEGTALEAGGNGVNMTTAGATIVLRLVNGQLVITSASSGLGSAVITSQGSTATGDTTNVWMLIAIMALAAGAVFAVKKIKV